MYICFSSVACRIAFQRSGLFFLYHVLFSPSEIRIMYMYTQNVNSMYMYTWHLLLNHSAMFYGTVYFILH